MPYCALMHDFAVTEEHVIFPVFPTTADRARIKAGGPHWICEPDKDSFVGIMPRAGSVRDMRWFRGPARSAFHFMNALHRRQPRAPRLRCAARSLRSPSSSKRRASRFDPEEMAAVNSCAGLSICRKPRRAMGGIPSSGRAATCHASRRRISLIDYDVGLLPDVRSERGSASDRRTGRRRLQYDHADRGEVRKAQAACDGPALDGSGALPHSLASSPDTRATCCSSSIGTTRV